MVKAQDIEDVIRNYGWMVREIERLRKELGMIEVQITSQFDDVSSSRSGETSNKTLMQVLRREHKQEVLDDFQRKVNFVEIQKPSGMIVPLPC